MENIKISDNDIAEIKMLQGKFQEIIFKFGELQIDKMELDRMVSEFVEKEKRLKEEWTNLQNMESSLMDKIVQKHGEGSLNLKDGTFIPTASK